jgi:hypothetical protein
MNGKVEILNLTRAEFFTALNTFKDPVLVGMKLPEWELPENEQQALTNTGRDSLVERELGTVQAGTEFELAAVADPFIRAIARPEMVIGLVLASKGRGRYMLFYNIHEDLIIEHLINEDGSHTLTHFKEIGSLFARFTELIPLQSVNREGRPMYEISQEQLESISEEVQKKMTVKKAKAILEKTILVKEQLAMAAAAVAKPLFSLSMACLVVEGKAAVEASSAPGFADEKSAWGIWPKDTDADPPIFWLMPAGINDIHSTLIDWFGIRDQLNEIESDR